MLVALCLFKAESVSSHEVRPALLQITERPNGNYDVIWKQPTLGQVAVRLEPYISGGLLDRDASDIETGPDFMLRGWRDLDAGPSGIERRTVHIDGLDRTITDVMVSITRANGSVTQQIVRPESPTLTIPLHGSGAAVSAYLTLGVEHILAGVDHLLFVLGLIFLVRSRRALVTTITAFTIAHSITLAGTVLGVVSLRAATVEALVALSIVFLAVEIIRSSRGCEGVTICHPALIAFVFGLLHGLAFAGALQETGLPAQNVLGALLLFNLGVEIGQLLFVTSAIALLAAWRRLSLMPALGNERKLVPYGIGAFASYWFFERLALSIQ